MRRISRKIKDLRLILGVDQTKFGDMIGDVDQSTVSRWERGIQKPTARHVIRLAKMADVTPAQFLGIEAMERGSDVGRRVRVIGELQAGDWREAVTWPTDDQYDAPLPPGVLEDVELQALEISGPSMNQLYPDGSIVYVQPISSVGRMPLSGERVAVQRVSADGLYEATCKEYVVDDDGRVWLWPRSYDPQHQAPLEYIDKRKRTDSVTILGIVRAALIVEPLRA